MTQNEQQIIKKAILDTVETYCNARIKQATFVQTEIGVVQGQGTQKGNIVTVKGATYDNILSVGNIIFPQGCVVQLFIPNAQYSNAFILGQLDDTPCNIKGGTINIGNGKFVVDNQGNATMKSAKITGGGLDIVGADPLEKVYLTSYTFDKGANANNPVEYVSGMSPKGGITSEVRFPQRYDLQTILDICGGQIQWYAQNNASMYKEFVNCLINGIDSDPNAIFNIGSGGGDEVNFNCPVTFHDTVYNSQGGTAFTSDRNAKENIKYLSDKESEDFIYSLKPCTFKYKSGERQHHGFIAQEVKESMSNKDWGVYIDPKIKGDKAEYKALRYEEIIADLVKVVQSQNKKIEELEKKVGDK